MNLLIAGKVAIALQIILLLIWAYSIFLSPNGTDPAGRGIAMVFLLGLVGYIVLGIFFLRLQKKWSLILVLVMAAIPLFIVIIGLIKEYGHRRS